jgi:hypothetical protein
MEKALRDRKLYKWMERVDADMAASAQLEGCDDCGSKVHRADYPRKPRVGLEELKDLVECWDTRWSWCCERDGCRKRKTPPSVRFLGRKVYVGVMVVLVAAMRDGLSAKRLEQLDELLGVDRRTLERWRAWWTEAFAHSAFWNSVRGRFRQPIAASRLPLALVEAFRGTQRAGLLKLLEFLSPITTSSCKGGMAM